MDWGSSSSESSSSSDDETRGATTLRERFLKRATEREEDEDRDRRRARRERRERAGKISKKDQVDDGGEWETVRKGAATSDKPKMFAKVCMITSCILLKISKFLKLHQMI